MGSATFNCAKCGFLLVEKELSIPDNLVDLDQVTNINLQPVISRYNCTGKEQLVEGKLNLQVFYAPKPDSQPLPNDLPTEPTTDENTISYLHGLRKDFYDDGFSDHDELEEETIKVRDNYHFINLETRVWDAIACFQEEGSFNLTLPAGSLWIPSEKSLLPRVKFVEYQVVDPRTLKLAFLVSLEVRRDETMKEEGVTKEHQVIFQLPPNHPTLEDVVDYHCRLMAMPEQDGTKCQVFWQLELAFLGRGQGDKPILGLTKLIQESKGQFPEELFASGVLPVEDTVLTPNGNGGIRLAVRLPVQVFSAELGTQVIDEDDFDGEDFMIPFKDYPNPAAERLELTWLQSWVNCDGMTEEEDEAEMGKKRRPEEEKFVNAWIIEEEENNQKQDEVQQDNNEEREDNDSSLDDEDNDDEVEETNVEETEDVIETVVIERESSINKEEDREDLEHETLVDSLEVEGETEGEPIAGEEDEVMTNLVEPIADHLPKAPVQVGPKVAFHSINRFQAREEEVAEMVEEHEETMTMSSRRQRLEAALAQGSAAKGNRGYSVMRINPRNS
ncbi:MAG: hypothetical protein ACYDG6_09790 [Thermincolia bacterium]